MNGQPLSQRPNRSVNLVYRRPAPKVVILT